MVLAAGLGTRLRPLTDDRPKALVELEGRTLLEITLTRLRSFGVSDVIINTHHFADKVADYLELHRNFGMRIEISREDVLLDTGGGLQKAAPFFQGDSHEPFLLHNVDVISDIDLLGMVDEHRKNRALATLAVMHRKSSRYLLFDSTGQLCGRRMVHENQTEFVRSADALDEMAFSGIHIISPQLLNQIKETGVFSIITTYLRLAGEGKPIKAFINDQAYWRDLGKPEHLVQAADDLRAGRLRIG